MSTRTSNSESVLCSLTTISYICTSRPWGSQKNSEKKTRWNAVLEKYALHCWPKTRKKKKDWKVFQSYRLRDKRFWGVWHLPHQGLITARQQLKVSKYQKQNTKFFHPPTNGVHFFSQPSKKWLKQKNKGTHVRHLMIWTSN